MSSLNYGIFGRFIILVLSGACLSKMSVRVKLFPCTLAQSKEEVISAENLAISIFLSLLKVSSLHDKAGRRKPIGH